MGDARKRKSAHNPSKAEKAPPTPKRTTRGLRLFKLLATDRWHIRGTITDFVGACGWFSGMPRREPSLSAVAGCQFSWHLLFMSKDRPIAPLSMAVEQFPYSERHPLISIK